MEPENNSGIASQILTNGFLLALKKFEPDIYALKKAEVSFNKFKQDSHEYYSKGMTALKERCPNHPLLLPFGLFRVTGHDRLETAHTRAISWFINPRGAHGFKATLLESLLREIDPGAKDLILGDVREVSAEKSIMVGRESRRMDIWAEGDWKTETGEKKPWLLWIEAKVDARIGDGQLEAYSRKAAEYKNHDRKYMVFLKPAGRNRERIPDGWLSLTFEQLAAIFHEASLASGYEPGLAMLRYYLAGVYESIVGHDLPFPDDFANPHHLLNTLKARV